MLCGYEILCFDLARVLANDQQTPPSPEVWPPGIAATPPTLSPPRAGIAAMVWFAGLTASKQYVKVTRPSERRPQRTNFRHHDLVL